MKEKMTLLYDQIYNSVDLVNETYPNCTNFTQFEQMIGKAFYWCKGRGGDLVLLGGYYNEKPQDSKEICKIKIENEWVGKGYWQLSIPRFSEINDKKDSGKDLENKDKLILLYLCSTDPNLKNGLNHDKDCGVFGPAMFMGTLYLGETNGELLEVFYNKIFPNAF